MFDVLKTLSGLIKNKKSSSGRVKSTVKHIHPMSPLSTPIQNKQPVAGPTRAELDSQIQIAQSQAKGIILEAQYEALKIRQEAEGEIRRKLEAIDRREGATIEKEKLLGTVAADTEKKRQEIDELRIQALTKLEQVAHFTKNEAKDLIISQVREKLKEEIAKEIREAAAKAQEESEDKAKEILVDAMRHGATNYVPEYTVSVVKITDEEVKGRIIGKEGRNIRAFETATGVDVDLDEEGVIRLSCFDPVRREIARVSLERLMRDGRVQPGRIEEIIEQVKKEIERIMFEEGQKLCHAVGVYNLPAPLIALLGRFKYRYSYGQNMIAHTLEETKIGIALAHEVGADVNIVRLGCLLHDIGKVISDGEGSHVDLGVQVLKKYGIPERVVDCVAQHHEDAQFSSVESMLVYISDAISGSRPGARYEDIEQYIKRLTDLEAIAKAHEGVKEAFAFQAGRELRVVVDPGRVDDATATIMASQIKDEVEKKLTYPGQIKISVIRELRATEIAK